jgi:hypothetical protein
MKFVLLIITSLALQCAPVPTTCTGCTATQTCRITQNTSTTCGSARCVSTCAPVPTTCTGCTATQTCRITQNTAATCGSARCINCLAPTCSCTETQRCQNIVATIGACPTTRCLACPAIPSWETCGYNNKYVVTKKDAFSCPVATCTPCVDPCAGTANRCTGSCVPVLNAGACPTRSCINVF